MQGVRLTQLWLFRWKRKAFHCVAFEWRWVVSWLKLSDSEGALNSCRREGARITKETRHANTKENPGYTTIVSYLCNSVPTTHRPPPCELFQDHWPSLYAMRRCLADVDVAAPNNPSREVLDYCASCPLKALLIRHVKPRGFEELLLGSNEDGDALLAQGQSGPVRVSQGQSGSVRARQDPGRSTTCSLDDADEVCRRPLNCDTCPTSSCTPSARKPARRFPPSARPPGLQATGFAGTG
jgi:hypothetical protein